MHIFKGSFLLENNLHNFSCVCCKYITAYLFHWDLCVYTTFHPRMHECNKCIAIVL